MGQMCSQEIGFVSAVEIDDTSQKIPEKKAKKVWRKNLGTTREDVQVS